MEIVYINQSNIIYLQQFIDVIKSPTFRYFNNRNISCIKNHVVTLIGLIDNNVVGYGHIDFDDNIYWLGICILDSYQDKGYGKMIMNKLLETFNNTNNINNLHLTVDINNTKAIKMYEKLNFNIINTYETYYKMVLNKVSNIIYLPVSYGEALDKLTILDIKMDKITDSRKKDVINEYNKLLAELSHHIKQCKFYYDLLKKINLKIWEDQDLFRYSNDNNYRQELCIQIIEDNDRRFRVKNKINNIMNSLLKEQKGYNIKETLYYDNSVDTNLFISQVRYLSTLYDMVTVYSNNTQCMQYFSDDTTIKVIITNDTNDTNINEYKWPININEYFYSNI